MQLAMLEQPPNDLGKQQDVMQCTQPETNNGQHFNVLQISNIFRVQSINQQNYSLKQVQRKQYWLYHTKVTLLSSVVTTW